MDLPNTYLKSVSDEELQDKAYTPYELEKYDRDSLEEIKKMLKKKKYKDIATIKESLEFLEKLSNKMNIAINAEKKENKTTWELEADLAGMKKLFNQLNETLTELEDKE